MSESPSDLDGLFDFYNKSLKVFYSDIQTENILPQEVLFEINAAFDHVSRIYTYNDSAPGAIKQAYSHLKRACLDIFKLKVKRTLDNYEYLKKINVSLIDNGDFEKRLHLLVSGIKKGTKKARILEGKTGNDPDYPVKAFEHWIPVYEKCLEFEADYFNHPHLHWAKRKGVTLFWKRILLSSIVSFFLGWVLKPALVSLVNWICGLFNE